mmetsp:Transcript_7878/g.19559  ORF Transcript_7878/g.19559 Transcript_7878/m.19559 type:complete len:163 (-) Transcript_7878:146-634(-)
MVFRKLAAIGFSSSLPPRLAVRFSSSLPLRLEVSSSYIFILRSRSLSDEAADGSDSIAKANAAGGEMGGTKASGGGSASKTSMPSNRSLAEFIESSVDASDEADDNDTDKEGSHMALDGTPSSSMTALFEKFLLVVSINIVPSGRKAYTSDPEDVFERTALE